jgi:hypothetical protein
MFNGDRGMRSGLSLVRTKDSSERSSAINVVAWGAMMVRVGLAIGCTA